MSRNMDSNTSLYDLQKEEDSTHLALPGERNSGTLDDCLQSHHIARPRRLVIAGALLAKSGVI